MYHSGLHGRHKKKDHNTMFISFSLLVLAIVLESRQAESKQFSKNMDQLRPFKASFYGVKVRTFPLGCFVYSRPEPAPPAASSRLEYTILSPCQGIPASQRLMSESASFPGAWVTIPEGSVVQGGMWSKPPSEFPVRNLWFCWWDWQ